MRPCALILSIFCAATMGLPHSDARSQMSNQDLFDLLDRDQEKETEGPGILGRMRDNADFKLIGRIMPFYQKADPRPGIDDRRFVIDGRFEFKSGFIEGRYQFGTSGWLEYGSQADTYSLSQYTLGIGRGDPGIERMRRYVELNELFWITSLDGMDVTFGKKRINMGMATLFSPVDRINPFDFNDPLHAKQYGPWQVRIDYFNGSTSYTLAMIPFFTPPKTPSERSRWRISSTDPGGGTFLNDFQFFNVDLHSLDADTGIDEDIPDGVDEMQILSRIKTIIKGWDLQWSGFTGVGPYPVLRRGNPEMGETALIHEYIRATTLSAGFSTTFAKVVAHGEGLVQWSRHDKDDDYFIAIGGLVYTLDDRVQAIRIDRVRVTAEYARETIIDRQNRNGFVESSEIVRIGQNDILTLVSIQFSDNAILEMIGDFNLDDGGWIGSPRFRYRPRQGFWITMSSEFFQGSNRSFYGRWEKNDRLAMGFEYSF